MRTFAVIPAAGRSRRMGQPKLLMPWGDSTVIEHVLAAWRASRVDHVVVVLDARDEQLAHLCAACGAMTAVPDHPPPEMKDSVRHGLDVVDRKFAPGSEDAWLVAPADMPALTADIIDRVIDAHAASLAAGESPCIWVPRHGKKRGHPVLFPWPLKAEVTRLGPDQGLNALYAQHPVEYVEAAADMMAEDFDTPQDYDRLRARRRR